MIKLLIGFYRSPSKAVGSLLDGTNPLLALGGLCVAVCFVFLAFALPLSQFQFVVNPQYESALRQYERELIELGEDPNYAAEWLDVSYYLHEPLPVVGQWGWLFFDFSFRASFSKVVTVPFCWAPFVMLLLFARRKLGAAGEPVSFVSFASSSAVVWTAAHLPFALIGLTLLVMWPNESLIMVLLLGAKAAFAIFATYLVRVVGDLSWRVAAITVTLSILSVFPAMLMDRSTFLLFLPVVFTAFMLYLGGGLSDLKGNAGVGGDLKKHLAAVNVNPRDIDAQLQLGSIYLRRHQYEDADRHFTVALQIDPTDLDALFHLGGLKRAQEEYSDAIKLYEQILEVNPRHHQWEAYRELGRTLFMLENYAEAKESLSSYCNQRGFDPIGLTYLADVEFALGQTAEAQDLYTQAIEAVHTAPSYRKHQLKQWEREAKKKLKSLTSSQPSKQ